MPKNLKEFANNKNGNSRKFSFTTNDITTITTPNIFPLCSRRRKKPQRNRQQNNLPNFVQVKLTERGNVELLRVKTTKNAARKNKIFA